MTKFGAFFWGLMLGVILPIVILSFVIGCATVDNRPKCTWICPTNNIPQDCYCLEEEINREADSMKTSTYSNGFHP